MQLCIYLHYSDVIIGAMASQINSLTIVYSTVFSGADQRKHQSSASLAFVWGIHRWSVNSPHKWPVTRKMSPFDDVIMFSLDDGPASLILSRYRIWITNHDVRWSILYPSATIRYQENSFKVLTTCSETHCAILWMALIPDFHFDAYWILEFIYFSIV